MITVYRWDEAPENLKALSDHGGDEEHVIVGTGHEHLDELMKLRDMFVSAIFRSLATWTFTKLACAGTARSYS